MRYSTPGVYIERLDRNPQRIGLRRTDVGGFVGVAARGPLHTPVKVESWRQYTSVFGDRTAVGYLAWAVAGYFENGGRTCWVVRAADPEQARPARIRLLVNGEGPYVLEAGSPGAWGNDIEIEAVWGRDRITHLVARTSDERRQVLDVTSLAGELPAQRRENLLGVREEDLPEVTEPPLVHVAPDSHWVPCERLDARAGRVRLAGGEDGLATLRIAHLVGDSDPRSPPWGLAALARIDPVSFVAVPDLMLEQEPTGAPGAPPGFGDQEIQDAQLEIIANCERLRDRVAILDLPRRADPSRAIAHAGALGRSSFAALYFPWILVSDPLRLRGVVRAIPPSGQVAGIFARSDRLRGVHKPPGNEAVEGAHDVTTRLDDASHGRLNDGAVNAIRPIPGRGLLLLGVRTLDPDLRWRYVNIRRLFAMLEEALNEQMHWAVFEPNSPRLWGEIERAVRGYLETLYRRGMLDGATSREAYFVRCDASTNPAWETDAGKATCVLGVQPPFPAEFVIVRIGVTRSGIEIEEKGAHDV